ncbi:MAG: hypothetical protein JWL93_2843 [Hyphomicrobiales bacterium]|jgi:hypothetical protein|nr:hypothetical protein [Hyphomicrobiales bacterium]
MVQPGFDPPPVRGPAAAGQQPGDGPRWAHPDERRDAPRDSAITRFMGGSPLAVLVRLIVVSLIVGALLMWLDIRPADIIYGVQRFFQRLWYLGFDAIGDVLQYIVAGAVIVVPIWLVMRLMSVRGR